MVAVTEVCSLKTILAFNIYRYFYTSYSTSSFFLLLGMLAAWFRVKYPHLSQGAIAGSAPILQFLDYYDCSLFNKIVTNDYQKYSTKCAENIKKTWPALRRLSSVDSGINFIKNEFQLCKTFLGDDVDKLINYFADIVVNG